MPAHGGVSSLVGCVRLIDLIVVLELYCMLMTREVMLASIHTIRPEMVRDDGELAEGIECVNKSP